MLNLVTLNPFSIFNNTKKQHGTLDNYSIVCVYFTSTSTSYYVKVRPLAEQGKLLKIKHRNTWILWNCNIYSTTMYVYVKEPTLIHLPQNCADLLHITSDHNSLLGSSQSLLKTNVWDGQQVHPSPSSHLPLSPRQIVLTLNPQQQLKTHLLIQ